MQKEYIPNDNITSDDRIWAAVAYLFSPLSPIFIHLMADKRSRPFIRAHYPQAFLSGLCLLLLGIPLALFTLGFFSIIWLVFPFWAYKAYNGENIEIPVISEYLNKNKWA
jgi:uncharacterized membrane protein